MTLGTFEGRYDDAFRSEFLFNLEGKFTRIGLSERIAPSDVDAVELYSRIIKPRILTQVATKNCYRSYDLNHVSALKIIDYKIDVLEKYTLNSTEFVQRFLELGGKIKDGTIVDADVGSGAAIGLFRNYRPYQMWRSF